MILEIPVFDESAGTACESAEYGGFPFRANCDRLMCIDCAYSSINTTSIKGLVSMEPIKSYLKGVDYEIV